MREIRSVGEAVRRAASSDAAVRPIEGYAAVFNRDATIAGIFVERIAPGAFAGAIARDDVRALFNHEDNYVLGRTAAGTLRLAEDAKGLRYEIDPPDTSWARDLVVSIERGDINQSSFAFRATKEQWDETGELPVRTVLEVELYDVSPVTYPAYDDTEVGVRALAEARSAGLLAATRPPVIATSVQTLRAAVEIDLRARTLSRL